MDQREREGLIKNKRFAEQQKALALREAESGVPVEEIISIPLIKCALRKKLYKRIG